MSIQTNLKDLTPRRDKFKKVITLLSGGFSSRSSFPEGEITVYPWDSSVDAWFQDRAQKGKQDTLFYDLLERLCSLNGCRVTDFVAGDVTTVLLVARSLRNDGVLFYTSKCPSCGLTDDESITVPNDLQRVGEKDQDYPGFDKFTLPECEDEITTSPLLVGQEMDIADRSDEDKRNIPSAIAAVLYSIQTVGGSEPEDVVELFNWYQAISPSDVALLEDRINTLNPHLNQEIPHKCTKCDTGFSHTLSLDREFFRRRHRASTGSTVASNVGPHDGGKGNDSRADKPA